MTKLLRKSRTSIHTDSILDRAMNFAFSIPDFRRPGRGNHRHLLGGIVVLMIFARMSKFVGRADIIDFGKKQSQETSVNGYAERWCAVRAENGIDSMEFASKMAEFSKVHHEELVNVCENLEIICIDGKAMYLKNKIFSSFESKINN